MDEEEKEALKDIGEEMRRCLHETSWHVTGFGKDKETGKWHLEMEHESYELGLQIINSGDDVECSFGAERALYECVKSIVNEFDPMEYAWECFDYDADDDEVEDTALTFEEEIGNDLKILERGLYRCLKNKNNGIRN